MHRRRDRKGSERRVSRWALAPSGAVSSSSAKMRSTQWLAVTVGVDAVLGEGVDEGELGVWADQEELEEWVDAEDLGEEADAEGVDAGGHRGRGGKQ